MKPKKWKRNPASEQNDAKPSQTKIPSHGKGFRSRRHRIPPRRYDSHDDDAAEPIVKTADKSTLAFRVKSAIKKISISREEVRAKVGRPKKLDMKSKTFDKHAYNTAYYAAKCTSPSKRKRGFQHADASKKMEIVKAYTDLIASQNNGGKPVPAYSSVNEIAEAFNINRQQPKIYYDQYCL